MSNAMLILVFLLAWFAGRLFTRIALRPLLAPRFTFEEANRLFRSRDVKIHPPREFKVRRQTAQGDTEAMLFAANVQVSKSTESAEYILDTTSGDELITLYDSNHKNMQVALRSGDLIQVDHGGVHQRNDFTHEEIRILTDLCARIRMLVKAPSFSHQ